MKKVLSMLIVLATVMLLLTVPTWALTEGDWEFILLDNEVTITGYIGNGGKVVIPETLFGCPVTKVDFNYGSKFSNVKSLTFPSTVKEIGKIDFTTRGILGEVIFCHGLETIGDYAFEGCGIRAVIFPSTLRRIGVSAFQNCGNLVSVGLPYYMDYLGNSCFAYCGIREVKVPETKDKCVPKSMFYRCQSLEKVVIPGSVEKIESGAFYGCESLKEVVLPVSLNVIDECAFEGCSALKEVVIPFGTKKVCYRAFAQCTSLKSLYMPDSVESIGEPYSGYYSHNLIVDSNNCIIYCSKDSYTEKVCRAGRLSYRTDRSVNSEITVLYNGTRISFHAYVQNPELLNNRTLVPLRSIFEAMGAKVEWDDTTSTAIAKRNGIEVKIQIGANEMYKNGNAVPVDVPAQLMNDRTMVPVRVIAEAFGADVQWNGNGNVVLINE